MNVVELDIGEKLKSLPSNCKDIKNYLKNNFSNEYGVNKKIFEIIKSYKENKQRTKIDLGGSLLLFLSDITRKPSLLLSFSVDPISIKSRFINFDFGFFITHFIINDSFIEHISKIYFQIKKDIYVIDVIEFTNLNLKKIKKITDIVRDVFVSLGIGIEHNVKYKINLSIPWDSIYFTVELSNKFKFINFTIGVRILVPPNISKLTFLPYIKLRGSYFTY